MTPDNEIEEGARTRPKNPGWTEIDAGPYFIVGKKIGKELDVFECSVVHHGALDKIGALQGLFWREPPDI